VTGPLVPGGQLFVDFADALETLLGRRVDLITPESIRNRISASPSTRRASSSMKLEAKKLLFDVIAACRNIEQFTAG
jgi:hypothetical protein